MDEAISALRRAHQPTPLPRRLPTAAEVDAAEQELATPFAFPADYRRFLLDASDVSVEALEPAVVVPGAGPDQDLVTVAREGWEDGVPTGWLPFCYDNSDYYCLDGAGVVRFWSHDGSTDESWPDLATWITEVWIEGL